MSTNINTIKTLGVVTVQLISPAVLIYLVLAAFASTLSPFNRFISVSAILMSTYLAILGLLIRAFGSRFNYVVGDLIRGIGTTVLLFGMAMLFLPIYAFTYSLYTQSIIPAALPILALAIYNAFLYTAVTAIVITAIIFLGFIAPLRPVSMDMAYMSGMLMYVIAMISMVIVLGTLTPYSGYITALSVIALVITIALISYRLLTAYLRLGESKVRDVYHEYAIRVMERITVSDYELINAINNFMMNGNKDALLEYSMKALTRCKNVGTKILDEIKKYEPPYYGGLWPWGSSDIRNRAIKDAELRSKISTEIITLISTCQGGKQEIQVASSHYLTCRFSVPVHSRGWY
ncbi:hypothetical protein [Vulcanisaeta sp. JCM 16159]|uniref:hypothetical protein n=1 Tax=Vulcanisaeta sp. JCM 16159 TaxID=1295371 RepID=UPI001FB20D91|nr:hypothetical protein [Vulcanisaeta sp. JCM 16159]